MSQAPTSAHSTSSGDLSNHMAVFRRHLKAENVSPATITAYVGALEQLDRFLEAEGRPRDIAAIRRQDIEAFLADILERRKPSTRTSDSAAASGSSTTWSPRATWKRARWRA